MGPLMHIPAILKLVAGVWIAALCGAVAGRSLAEVSVHGCADHACAGPAHAAPVESP
jgi:hypothetical protein